VATATATETAGAKESAPAKESETGEARATATVMVPAKGSATDARSERAPMWRSAPASVQASR
jgi:hypothetical protein